MTGAFYERDGERFVPSELTRGPWDPGAQHAGPPSALIARALERCEPRDGMRLARDRDRHPRPGAARSADGRGARGAPRPQRRAARGGAGRARGRRDARRRLAGRRGRCEHGRRDAAARPRAGRGSRLLPHRPGGRLPHGDGVPLRGGRLPRDRPGHRLAAHARGAGRGRAAEPARAPDGRGRRGQRRQRRARLARAPLHQHRADRAPAARARGRVGRARRGHARGRPGARRERDLGPARARGRGARSPCWCAAALRLRT